MIDENLMQQIVDCAFIVHKQLGKGFLESIYQKAMMMELAKHSIEAEAEVPLKVFYDGVELGAYRADMLVEKKVIVELKAVDRILRAHEAQLVHYLRATGIEVGLLLNFEADEMQLRRKYRDYRPRFSRDITPYNRPLETE